MESESTNWIKKRWLKLTGTGSGKTQQRIQKHGKSLRLTPTLPTPDTQLYPGRPGRRSQVPLQIRNTKAPASPSVSNPGINRDNKGRSVGK